MVVVVGGGVDMCMHPALIFIVRQEISCATVFHGSLPNLNFNLSFKNSQAGAAA